jgi:hypothetical protein
LAASSEPLKKRKAGRLPEPVTDEMRKDVSTLWHKLLLTNKKKADKIKAVYFSGSSDDTFDLNTMPDAEFKKFRRDMKLFEKSISEKEEEKEEDSRKRARLDEDIKSLVFFQAK